MLSNSSKYALKAVLFLAINSDEDKKVMAKHIAELINVPQAYIAKLLQELVKQNIISSLKGPKGGFYLNKSNRQEPVIKIIKAIDGEKRLVNCLLSLEKCNEEKPCPLHKIANPTRSKLIHNLKSKSINDLALDIKNGDSFLPL